MIKRISLMAIVILMLLFTPAMSQGEFDGAFSNESKGDSAHIAKVEDRKSSYLSKSYLKDVLMSRTSIYKDALRNDSLDFETQGVIMAKTGSLFFVDAGGDVRNEEGIITWKGKKYYTRKDGIIVRERLIGYEGELYASGADGSLIESGWVKVGKLTYHFEDYKVDDTCIKAMEILDEVGYDLESAFMWAGNELPYFSFDSNPSWGIKWFADYGFQMERGNCYVMAATFYYMAKMLGYDAYQVAGEVLSEHSWIEIIENGGVKVYDPELYAETNGRRFVFGETYDNPFLTEYHDWERMALYPKGRES